ncbi:MAG: NADP-specific glutamate dehydrogenase [Lachnospiraceae bacterium]|nr:NADP-specific glutamate dehydrogenase [Lachnospiraceae bacterium]
MGYVNEVFDKVVKENPNEPEFHQAVKEVFSTLEPVVSKNEKIYKKAALLERIVEPERIISFRVPWVDDKNQVHVNKGYRIQFNSAIGPYKGGIRLHPSVNQGILKFLGFEQIFKNSLTGLPMGGAKGGSNFDPKGKSDNEVMRFCQSFMSELYKYIGKDTDVPAGDIGTGAREIGFMFGQYKKLTGLYEGVLTGKGLTYGGSLARTEATGYGVGYMAAEILNGEGSDVSGKRVGISGSGNVAIYCAKKFEELGAKVVTLSDSNGYIYDENGIDVSVVKEIKEVKRGRIKDYLNYVKSAKYVENEKPWVENLDIAAPCATQNEVDEKYAKLMVKNGVKLVVEGANMPLDIAAINVMKENKILYMPGKAANAGGVSVSGLEMSQNSLRLSWTFDEVDNRLKDIMKNIYKQVTETACEFGLKGDFVAGANIAGFKKVAEAMLAQGIC